MVSGSAPKKNFPPAFSYPSNHSQLEQRVNRIDAAEYLIEGGGVIRSHRNTRILRFSSSGKNWNLVRFLSIPVFLFPPPLARSLIKSSRSQQPGQDATQDESRGEEEALGRPFEKTPIFEGRSIDPLLFSPLLFLITNEKNDFPGEIRKNPSKILPIPSIENAS